jgi:uncharacterized phage protein gp47/JayE
MKTYRQIMVDLIADFQAVCEKVTYFGKDSVTRGIFHPLSLILSEIWNDLYQVKRQMFVETAEGSDLDAIGARQGLTRRGASKSSAVLLLSGTAGTVIPQFTIVKSNLSNVSYKTLEAVTLGTRNSSVLRPLFSETIGDAVLAESLDAGSNSAAGVNELTQFQTPITGVAVTNLTPSEGGEDAESDDNYRLRIINQITLLNQGTKLFYRTCAIEADSRVIKAAAIRSEQYDGAAVYLVKNDFGLFSPAELTAIAASIKAKQRAMDAVTCFNAGVMPIEVVFKFSRDNSIALQTIFTGIASGIADYVQSVFDLGAEVEYQKILNIIINTPGVELEAPSLKLNNGYLDVKCSETQAPRFTFLKIDDGTAVSQNISQTYLIR